MNWDKYFQKVVIESNDINHKLTPKVLSDGTIVNANISELRRELEYCYEEIDGYLLKEMFLDFIEDYWSVIYTSISSKKGSIKTLKRKIKEIGKNNPDIDYNNIKNTSIIDEINSAEFKLAQEKFVLRYLKEQQFFIRSWVAQKRTDFKELPRKKWENEERKRLTIKRLVDSIKSDHTTQNKYPNIFINGNAFKIFTDYMDSIQSNYLTEYSFLYRVMTRDGLMHNTVKVNIYKTWLNDEFEQDFTKIKTLNNIGAKHRIDKYIALLKEHPLASD